MVEHGAGTATGQPGGRAALFSQDQMALWAHRAGWQLLGRLPEVLAYEAAERFADRMYAAGGRGVAQLRRNYRRIRPELGRAAVEGLVKDGLRAYARYWCDLFRMERWSDEKVDRLFATENESGFSDALHRSGGTAVLFLGHLGNWDLAGRWAGRHVAPVTSVAERLRPDALFDAFVATRRRLGITVLPLTGGDPPFPALRDSLRDGGLVALVADRDLTGAGVPVLLGGHEVRIAAGPAALARSEHAPLVPVFLRRDESQHGAGARRTIATFGTPVTVSRDLPARDAVRNATQEVADQLGDYLRRYTAEWHMLQPVFTDDMPPARRAVGPPQRSRSEAEPGRADGSERPAPGAGDPA